MLRRTFTKWKNLAGALQRRKLSAKSVVAAKMPDIDIPREFLQDYVWKDLDKWHDKTAVVCAETGRSYKYLELYKKSRALANFLHKFPKLSENDTVAVILPNVPEFPIVLLGAVQAGLKATTVNWIYTPDEMFKQLSSSETKMIFTSTELHPKVRQAANRLKDDVPIVVINREQQESIPPNTIAFRETVEGDHELLVKQEQPRSVDEVVFLLYSSGTTGVSKGVEVTHKSVTSNLHQMTADGYKLHRTTEGTYQEVVPCVLPWFHAYGLVMGLFQMLASGCKLITTPKFGADIFLRILAEHQPTFAHFVPPMILLLINNPNVKPEHITRMHTMVCGAAPLGVQDLARLQAKCREVNILQAYGLTEASPLTHTQTPHIDGGIKQGGSGFLLPNTECKIIAPNDETLTGLAPYQSGELFIRGPQVMKGYFKNDEATKAAILPGGWLRTGDIGHYDEDGHFFITDRLKELIKVSYATLKILQEEFQVKGYQVAPAELEELLRDYPDIADAAVIGIPHGLFGEAPKAFVVLKEGKTLNLDKITEYMTLKAAPYKQLVGGVVQVDNVPRSQSGKILRRQLKDISR